MSPSFFFQNNKYKEHFRKKKTKLNICYANGKETILGKDLEYKIS